MDWRREGRKRAEGIEPEKKLSLTSKFSNSKEDNEAFEEEDREREEDENRRLSEPVRRF
jgi:hypothetical protein